MGSVSLHAQANSQANLQTGSRGERLSALIDGEWQGEDSGAFIAALDHEDRAAWSNYHLIGDALRSDDLALSASASRAFMSGFGMGSPGLGTEWHAGVPYGLLLLKGPPAS